MDTKEKEKMKEFLGKERKRGLKTGMPLEMVH
jgi:hypothetical protein